jgi:alpha-tubulin suppressor-like RCC1 family protein
MAALNKWYIDGTTVAGVMRSDGSLVGWGWPFDRELGTGGNTGISPTNLTLANSRTAQGVLFANRYTVVVCNDGSVQVVGRNANGQLGRGDTTDVTSGFVTVSLANGKLAKKVIGMAGGTGTAVLCTDGTVQATGTLGRFHTSLGSSSSFIVADALSSISVTDIAHAGFNDGFIAITSNNKVYIRASLQNSAGNSVQFGSLTELTLPSGRVPKQVFGSTNKAGVLCTNGEAYFVGSVDVTSGFPTGMNRLLNTATLMPTPSNKAIKWLAVSFNHTIIITTDNLVYVTGRDPLGEGILGLGATTSSSGWTQVTSLASDKLPIAVEACDRMTFMIYDDGTVQGAGRNAERQLGDGTTTNRNVFTDIAQISGAQVLSTTITGLDSAPGAPTGVSGTPGNGQVSVSFTQPASNGGQTITRYNVISSPGGIDVSGASTTIVVTGLTNGTAYTFKVTATNSVGTSVDSSASAPVTPRTVPGAPTGVSATGANRQATVSFTAPDSNGGSAIIGYTVTASPGGATASGASSPLTVTGLTNGTSYTFTVKATNIAGDSVASSASSSVTPSVSVPDLNTGNISSSADDIVVAGSRTITAKKQAKSAGAVSYAPDAANKPSVAISNIPAAVQDVVVGVAATDASGIAVVKIVALNSEGALVTDFTANPLTVRVTLPGFTSAMATIQTSATLGGNITDTITAYRVGTNLYEFTTTHLTYFAASQYVPCFVAGTRILTAEGYKAVETLTADDLIRTADNRIVPFRMYTTQIEATSPETAPYTIPANTFGRACPATDLTISPYHAIQSAPNTWQIPKYATQMFRGITQAPAGRPITYYHLELPNYFKDNLVAEGTVVESYGNRQTAGMKTVYRLNAEHTGFTRMEKSKSAKKTA